jgi:hypothetical protein
VRLRLVPTIAILLLGLAVHAAPSGGAPPKNGKKIHCKKGQIRKHKHGEWVCVTRPPKPTPHPGLDVLGTPGTYVGSNGVTVTSSTTAEGAPQISMTIVFPAGYVSCAGKPPYPSLKISVADMLVSGYGEFNGTSSAGGAYAQIQGHFTGPNTLTLESAGAGNVLVHGERCAAQYTNASIVF